MVLKNLDDIFRTCKIKDYECNRELYKKLKQEAIKRIKIWQLQRERFKKRGNEDGVNCVEQIQNEYIEFFNIKVEDLQ